MALYSGYDTDRVSAGPHDIAPSDPGAAAFLAEAKIGDGWLHPRSSNYTFVVELECEGRNAFGVYKPAKGEAPLWDFPWGTLYQRECAMYELARLLGWGLVPPTVERDGEGGIGSLQLFVPSVDDENFFTMRDSHRDALLRMAVLDTIANNADRKGGHCLKGADGQLWGVDHGLTFHQEHKLRTVIWDFGGGEVPEELLAQLRELFNAICSEAPEAERLASLISEREMEALRTRVRELIERPTLPQPHSRRDVPWPWL